MLQGNKAYDKNVEEGYLSVEISDIKLRITAEAFIGLDDQQLVTDTLHSVCNNELVAGGVFVLLPYAFAMVCSSSHFVVADSHCHGKQGGLLVTVFYELLFRLF